MLVSAAIMTPGSRFLSRLEDLGIGTVKCEILTEAQFHVSFHDPDDDSEIRFGLDIASVDATPRRGHREPWWTACRPWFCRRRRS